MKSILISTLHKFYSLSFLIHSSNFATTESQSDEPFFNYFVLHAGIRHCENLEVLNVDICDLDYLFSCSDLETRGELLELILRKKGSTVVDRLKHSQMEDEQTVMTRMMKGAMAGLMPGIMWGVFAANAAANVQPPTGMTAASPKVIPTLKVIGNKGLIGAGTGVLWFGVKLLVEKYRVKRDFLNDVAGGFVAGATLAGLRWRRIPVAIFAGATLGNVPVVLDSARIYKLKVKNQSGEQRNQHLQEKA